MRIKILGSAAGGGFPQWNCTCENCSRMRSGKLRGRARTQTQIAFEANPAYALRRYWTLVNASPDLRAQINATPELAPFPNTSGSNTPIRDIYLPSADVDSLMGLLHLREFQAFRIHSLPAIRRILSEENSIFEVLGRARPPVQWFSTPLALSFSPVQEHDEKDAPQLLACGVPLGGEYPDYISENLRKQLPAQEAVAGLVFEYCGKRIFIAPAVPGRDAHWKRWAETSDLVLIDGTFWSDDELIRTRRSTKTAREIGHLPLWGPRGLFDQYPKKAKGRKILIHINNTNPILNEESREYYTAISEGFEIASDGMEIDL